MADTLGTLLDDTQRRLGDTEALVWAREELTRYAQEGYDLLCQRAQCILETDYIEDYGGNVTGGEWELAFLRAGDALFGMMTHTAEWERDYFEQDGLGHDLANHNYHWEKALIDDETYRAAYPLPSDLLELERATWNNRRLTPMEPSVVETQDTRYEQEKGPVEAYLVSKDGWNRFRKWRVPNVGPDEFTTTGTFGILRDPDDISEEEVIGTWGIPRILPGMHLMRGPWGFPRRAYQDVNGTRIEFYRRGEELAADNTEFEIPQRFVKYVMWFVLGRALNRQGAGQDTALAAHWMQRYEDGVRRATNRKFRVNQFKIRRIEDYRNVGQRPPLAKLPWNYGKVVS